MMKKRLRLALALICLTTSCAAVAAATARLQGDEKLDVSGTWLFEVETSAGSGSPTFTFKQEGELLSGQYKGQLGEAPLSGTLKGKEIKFSFTVAPQGDKLIVTYTGSVEKNAMKGTLQVGDLGSGTWQAKRQPKEK